MKLPNRAVKVGGIFAIGLVAIGLSFGLLFSGPAQAHDPDHEAETETVPVDVNTPAAEQAMMVVSFVGPEVTGSIDDTLRRCFGYEMTGEGSVSAEVVGSAPVKTGDEFSEQGQLCVEFLWHVFVKAQAKVWQSSPASGQD